MALIMAALWTAVIMAIMTVCGLGVWRLFLWISGRGIEQVRTSSQVAQINAHHARLQQLLEMEEKRKREAFQSTYTDLDGKRIYLNREQLQGFRAVCLKMLDLGANQQHTQASIRQHWRKRVIRWHPDQGGDAGLWLVRLRAYEALMEMGTEQN